MILGSLPLPSCGPCCGLGTVGAHCEEDRLDRSYKRFLVHHRIVQGQVARRIHVERAGRVGLEEQRHRRRGRTEARGEE